MLVVALSKGHRALTGNVQPTDVRSLWRMGLGREQDYSIAMTSTWDNMGGNAFYGTAIIANGLQFLMTCCWYLSNSLLTSMVISHHWGKFLTGHQRLRVSVPKGRQKSSYFLSLPYRYSIPLLVCSALIHLLLSQSIFVVQTRGYFYTASEPEFDRALSLDASVVGYSAIGLVLSLGLVGILILALFCFALRPLPDRRSHRKSEDDTNGGIEVIRMPLASTCSAAISAACHNETGNEDLDMFPLQWGPTETGLWGFSSFSGDQLALDEDDGTGVIYLTNFLRNIL